MQNGSYCRSIRKITDDSSKKSVIFSLSRIQTLEIRRHRIQNWITKNTYMNQYRIVKSPLLLVAMALIAMTQTMTAVTVSWTGAVDQNWSTSGNWSGGTPGGNDLIFNGVGSVTTAGQVDNIVDQNTSAISLIYTNSVGDNQYHTTQIQNGVTLTDTGTFSVGNLNQDNFSTTVNMVGSGTFLASGTSFNVGMNGTNSASSGKGTLDMSGLSNFVYNASGGTWVIAGSGGAARAQGVINLAGFSNNITVGTINFNTGSGNNSSFHSLIQFGG